MYETAINTVTLRLLLIKKKLIHYIKKRQSSQQLTNAHCSCGLASRSKNLDSSVPDILA